MKRITALRSLACLACAVTVSEEVFRAVGDESRFGLFSGEYSWVYWIPTIAWVVVGVLIFRKGTG